MIFLLLSFCELHRKPEYTVDPRAMLPFIICMGCPFCHRHVLCKTNWRHTRSGCDAAQREALQRNTTLQRILNPDMTAAPDRPRGRRMYHRRNPPTSPRLIPTQSTSRQPGLFQEQSDQPTSADPRTSPPDSIEDKLEALIHDLPQHPNR
ncbi:hypothetical protein BDV93DRAFT_166865 [Ceratobasidium sp. AG-I]|nr:hypothetical protein BDV93DRAFT_166865 [Ceratobasidium sp. AG-I]